MALLNRSEARERKACSPRPEGLGDPSRLKQAAVNRSVLAGSLESNSANTREMGEDG